MRADAGWMEALGEGSGEVRGAGGVTALALWAGGLAALVLGTGMALGDRLSPEVGWISLQLSQIGVTAGPILACGALGVGLAWLARLQRKQSEQLEVALDHDRVLAQLASDFGGLRANLSRVQLEFAEVLQTNRALLGHARQQSEALQASEPTNDAIFRLAASMDQLGARVETRVRTFFDQLEEKVTGLELRLDETAHRQRGELERLEERLTVAATLAQRPATEIPYVEGAVEAAVETGDDENAQGTPTNDALHAGEEPTAQEPTAKADDEPQAADPDGAQDGAQDGEEIVEIVPQDEWLEIEVELEEQAGDDALDGAPGLFDRPEHAQRDAFATNDHWFEEATRGAGIEFDEPTAPEEPTTDLFDLGEPPRLSPAECAPVDTDAMLQQLDTLLAGSDSVADVLEDLRRRRGE